MARETTGSIHIGSIAVDISGVRDAFQEIREMAQTLRDDMSQTLTLSANSTDKERQDFLANLGLNDDSIDKAKEKIRLLFEYIGNTGKVQIKAKDGELFQAIVTSADNATKKVYDLKKEIESIEDFDKAGFAKSVESTVDYGKQAKEIENQTKEIERQTKQIQAQINALRDLSLTYTALQRNIEKANISGEDYSALSKAVEEAQAQIKNWEENLKTGKVSTDEVAQAVKNLQANLKVLKLETDDAKAVQSEWDKIIQESAKALEQLQKETENQAKEAERQAKQAEAQINALRNLGLAYDNLQQKIDNKSIVPKDYAEISTGIDKAKTEIDGLIAKLGKSETSAEEAGRAIQDLRLRLKEFDLEAKKSHTLQKELDDIAKAAEKAAKSADKFDLSKLNKRGKRELASLKREFDELAASIRNGTETNIPQARQRLEELQAAMERVTTSTDTTTGAFQKFTNALADKAKWYAAFQVVNTIERAFGQTINVIKNTEDSVVELKRVLNENVSSTAISDALYDIAYRYGQTFDAVQESAVLFAQTGKSWQETLAATEATMLALNTAELDTTQATSGLIAVMSQFKIEADDLEVVIDKINKTADNFPVTSEKIVSALQRTGATAHAAGMELEDTIAVITALSKATGRSGENIGTALNSLIQYSQKASSLEVFSGISEKMEKVVQAYKNGSVNILKVWEQLAEEIDTLTAQQQEALFSTEEYKEFADTLESEASEYTDKIKEIYDVAGTYRQVYFVSLLKNIGTVTEAMENMAGAEGYSLRENETAMDTLTHRYNQLIASLQELAVQVGNSGLLALAKVIVSVTVAIFKAIGATKQLVPLIGLVASAIVLVRAESAAMAAQSKLAILKQGWINLKSVITGTAVATEGATTAATGLAAALGTFTLAISIIGAIVQGIKAIEQHARAARQEVIQLGKEASESGKDLGELYSQYKNATTGTQQEDLIKELMQESGISTRDIEKRIALRERENGVVIDAAQALEELLDIELQEKAIALEEANEAKIKAIKDETEARKELADVGNKILEKSNSIFMAVDFEFSDQMQEFVQTLTTAPKSIDEVNSHIEILTNSLAILRDKELETGQDLISNEDVAKIEAQIEYYQKLSDEYEENKIQAELMRLGIIEYSKALERSKEENDAMVKAIMEATGATEEQAQATLDAADAIEQYKEAVDSLVDKTKDMENGYDKVVKAIKEYNETGKITADTLRDIVKLGPEYMELIEFEGNQAKINKEAYEKLNGEYKKSMLALESLATEGNRNRIVMNAAQSAVNQLASSESNTASVTDSFRSKVMTLTSNLINGKISSDQYRAQLVLLAQQMGITAAAAQDLAFKVNNANTMMKAFMIGIGQSWNLGGGTTVVSGGGGGGGGGGGKAKTAAELLEEQIQELKKVYDDEVDAIEHQIFLGEKHKMSADDTIAYYRQLQEKAHQQAEKYRAMGVAENSKYLAELSKAWWGYQDDIEDLLSGVYEKQINEYENALKMLERYYDTAEARFDVDTMQSNLKAQISVQQRIMQSAYNEYIRLINSGKDANDDAVQDVIATYYDAAEEIRDINSKIADNILGLYDDFIDLADSLDVWDRLNFTKVEYLEKKLHEINRLYKEGTILLKEYKELLEDTAVDYYNARKAALEKQQEDIEEERDNLIDQYNAEIEALRKRKEESDNYYDGLIEQLRQVSEDYDRINQQLDYYTNRQKILTNIEQAQARSGIEWREKEMQYQQQLIELDENWRRTQEDWSISDQIAELERLKEQAASDIEASIEQIQAYIEAAKNTAAASIKDIQNEVDELKYKIYDAITKAMQESVENAAIAIDGTMAELTEDTEQAANDSQNAWEQEFAEPIKAEIIAIGQMMKDQLVDDGTITAKNLADVFRQYFISPIKAEINSLMSDVTAGKGKTSGVAKTSNSVYNNKNTANIYANINNTSTANSFLNGWDRGFFLSPIKYYSSKK